MPSIVVSCHGGRGAGTSQGTYVIPRGVTIYFFTDDAINLSGGSSWTDTSGVKQSNGATWIESLLLSTHPDEHTVRKYATEVKREFETVPNYTAQGAPTNDPAFTYKTGLFWVGSDPNNGPMYPIPDGQTARLSSIIGGGKGGVNSTCFYWLCCRDAPRNSNNTKSVSVGTFGQDEVGSVSGLKPSAVAAAGRWR